MPDKEQYGYGILLDSDADDAGAVYLDVAPGTSTEMATGMLVALFDTEAAIDSVVLLVNGRRIGVSTRRRLDRLKGTATRGGVGDSDHLQLPGHGNYQLLRFRCQVCKREVRRIHLDVRSWPSCPSGHGPLERTR